MPIATIDAEGTRYAFTDSGAPPGQDFKTLILLHGTIFNGESFEPLLPSFKSLGIRVINVTRRHYGETSDHSAEDAANVAKGNDIFLKVLAKDMANLLIWVLDNLGPFNEKSLALLGWSMATSTTLSLFGQPGVVPQETYDTIARYLNKLIVYDSPLTAYGFDMPDHDGLYNPFLDHSFSTIEEYSDNINMYLSMYFDHPDPQSGRVDFSRNGVRPTMARMTPDDRMRVMESKAAAAGVDAGAVPYPPIQGMLRTQADTALFSDNLVLPSVPVVVLGCMSSAWFLLWAFVELRRKYQVLVEKGLPAREIAFVELPDANHFVHYDAPNDFIKAVVKSL